MSWMKSDKNLGYPNPRICLREKKQYNCSICSYKNNCPILDNGIKWTPIIGWTSVVLALGYAFYLVAKHFA